MVIAGTSPIHSTVTSEGAAANTGKVMSPIVIICVTFVEFPQSSVTLYVLVITSGQLLLSDTSDTKATTGLQKPVTPVTTDGSGAGISPMH